MTSVWKDMPAEERVRNIHALQVRNPKISGGGIAQAFPGATRSAVLGFCYRRHIRLHGRVDGYQPPARYDSNPRNWKWRRPPKPQRAPAWHPLPSSKPIDLLELDRTQCSWPVDIAGKQHYCGLPVDERKSTKRRCVAAWCKQHRALGLVTS